MMAWSYFNLDGESRILWKCLELLKVTHAELLFSDAVLLTNPHPAL